MNAQLTSEIRELTAAELDAVSGGSDATDIGYFFVVAGFTSMVGLTVGKLLDLIFGD
jgi:hypothetical protein